MNHSKSSITAKANPPRRFLGIRTAASYPGAAHPKKRGEELLDKVDAMTELAASWIWREGMATKSFLRAPKAAMPNSIRFSSLKMFMEITSKYINTS
uniref:Uncharacterized protein n=1 Tax=Glossina palpalis gambiensis TaxID=67801 RepID=A0A1B0BHI3_9MUSC